MVSDAAGNGLVAVSVEHFMWFVDNALDQMAEILRELGDDLVNERPDLEGANSPYVICYHSLGVMEFWGGATVAERPITRDRAAEFVATGTVAELLARASAARRQLEEDLTDLHPMAVPASVGGDAVPYNQAKGSVLLHIIEELYQHLGQMELTRDALVAG
jgi:hypothetical protein